MEQCALTLLSTLNIILAEGITMQDIWTSLVGLCAGMAIFLYSIKMTSSSLESIAGNKMKDILAKLTGNRFVGVGVGAGVTALIQSSTATIVITSGLVAAEIISLKQSLGIIIGANVGTTITGQIIRLMDINSSSTAWLQIFKPATLAPIALIIGIIFIMFCKLFV